jgi:hypothetical protein
MQHDWILDVLADLTTFARRNGLTTLAEELDDAQLVAAAEIGLSARGGPVAGGSVACEGDAEGVRDRL